MPDLWPKVDSSSLCHVSCSASSGGSLNQAVDVRVFDKAASSRILREANPTARHAHGACQAPQQRIPRRADGNILDIEVVEIRSVARDHGPDGFVDLDGSLSVDLGNTEHEPPGAELRIEQPQGCTDSEACIEQTPCQDSALIVHLRREFVTYHRRRTQVRNPCVRDVQAESRSFARALEAECAYLDSTFQSLTIAQLRFSRELAAVSA